MKYLWKEIPPTISSIPHFLDMVNNFSAKKRWEIVQIMICFEKILAPVSRCEEKAYQLLGTLPRTAISRTALQSKYWVNQVGCHCMFIPVTMIRVCRT